MWHSRAFFGVNIEYRESNIQLPFAKRVIIFVSAVWRRLAFERQVK